MEFDIIILKNNNNSSGGAAPEAEAEAASNIVSKLLVSPPPHHDTANKTTYNFNDTTKDSKSYEDRLLSFNPLTYYAKPRCLSPIICAGLG